MSSECEEKDAIRELLARYCYHFDGGEFEQWLDLFTADGAFDLGTRGRFVGRDGLRDFLKIVPLTNGQPMMRHCVTNVIVELQGDHATAQSYVLVVRGGETIGVTVVGRYNDRLVKQNGAWRFQERTVLFDMIAGS